MKLAYLHTQSNHSHLRGVLHPQEIVTLAKAKGLSAIALTDLNSVAGLITFYTACKQENIKAIIGTKIANPDTNDYLILLSKNSAGYAFICETVTARNLDPDFKLTTLQYNKNCIWLTSSMTLAQHFLVKGYAFFLELILYPEKIRAASLKILTWAEQHQVPLVASNPVFLEKPSDFELHKILRAIANNCSINDLAPQEFASVSARNYFLDATTLQKIYADYPQALENTWRIAETCFWDWDMRSYKFPRWNTQKVTSSYRQLLKLCFQGLRKRVPRLTPLYLQRLRYELQQIHKLNFTAYFLVVWDIVRYARQEQIISIGRGSAANSLVAFCLGITHVDPLKHQLYFERFLNPARQDPPDIDLDFCWQRRSKVLMYVFSKYGQRHVSMICTTITMGLRSAFREVGKVMGISDQELSSLTKKFPYFTRMVESINQFKEQYPECCDLPLENEPWKTIFYLAQRLAAFPRHLSVHPGGIIICPEPLTNYTALQKSANGLLVTQYDMYSLEPLGLIKIDLLGNRSLAVYQDCLELLSQEQTPKIPTLTTIIQDPATKKALETGNTIGCFYIESPAMRSLLQKLQTNTFEELVAASSVIRPGVAESGMMDQYIERKLQPQKATYLHPELQKILGDTYGVMVYQEDVLKVAHFLAGMSLAEADLFRRAISGKARSRAEVKKLNQKFIQGCIQNGCDQKIANEIWRQVASFAGYSFCKAHSASYAQLSFKMAYLKTHYPAKFMASVINNGGGFYSTETYINEARRMGLRIKLPCVNNSAYFYTALNKELRIGLNQLREISFKAKETILVERKKGQYLDLANFITRTKLSFKTMEILILVGACDCFGYTRPELMFALSLIYEKAKTSQTGNYLFPLTSKIELPLLEDFTEKQKIHYELKHLGLIASCHPLELVSKKMTQNFVSSQAFSRYQQQKIQTLGWCIAAKTIRTRKKNSYMKFLSMEDCAGTYEVTLFPQTYQKYALLSHRQGPYIIEGVVHQHFGVNSLIASRLELINKV